MFLRMKVNTYKIVKRFQHLFNNGTSIYFYLQIFSPIEHFQIIIYCNYQYIRLTVSSTFLYSCVNKCFVFLLFVRQ